MVFCKNGKSSDASKITDLGSLKSGTFNQGSGLVYLRLLISGVHMNSEVLPKHF